jgi:hypothetical protein
VTADDYTITAYIVATALLWGYALLSYMHGRKLCKVAEQTADSARSKP